MDMGNVLTLLGFLILLVCPFAFVYNLAVVIYDTVRQAMTDAPSGQRSKPKMGDNMVWAGVSLLLMLLAAMAA